MRSWIPRIKLNTIYTKLLATYLMLTAFGTSLMAGYILWSFYDYFMRSRQIDLDNWTSALSESVADGLEEKKYSPRQEASGTLWRTTNCNATCF